MTASIEVSPRPNARRRAHRPDMRALFYAGDGRVEWRDVPTPRLEGPGEALVRPLAVTRCDLDVAIVTGAAGWPGGFALGHEMVGVVTDIGDSVSAFRPGDRVIVPFQISCGECGPCRRGLTGVCEGVPFRSSYGMAPLSGVDYGGAISDLLRVPFADHMLVPAPQGVSSEAAAGVADNVADGYRSVAPYLAGNPGARVLVLGGRSQGIGLYAAEAARALGASEVVYLDDDPSRLAIARTLGVTVMTRAAWEGRAPGAPYPITVDATGASEGLALAIRSTEHGGTCHRTYGDLEPMTPVPLRDMYGVGLSLHLSRVHARTLIPEVSECIRCGHLHPEKVISRTARFAEAAEVIFDPTVKVVFINEDA